MSEYIIDWGGIGARLVELYEERVPLALWPKRLRKERLREEIVRCRDCKHYNGWACEASACSYCDEPHRVEPDGFCAWACRKERK